MASISDSLWLRETIGVLKAERRGVGVLGATEPRTALKLFSFLNTRSDFLTVAVVPALLATPSAALGDSVSSASVAARPIYGDDVLEDPGCLTPCPHAGHSVPG